jgi:protoporphyrinogen oxidase
MASKSSKQKIAIIIGAGPAGLTAAYELLHKTDIKPIILEKSEYMGGISRTINYKGNRIDIGGHRFFSKSDRVMDFWANIIPMENTGKIESLHYQGKQTKVNATKGINAKSTDSIMLVRNRKSRIYFLRKFFDYPVSLSMQTINNLGITRMIKIGFSYIKIRLFPIRNEKNLEQFFINRFGNELYLTFFKSYTEKVWGVACNMIAADWGAQRIKGLSISKAIQDVFKKMFKRGNNDDIRQKDTETSLIEKFLYPKYGPGQMWEEVAKIVIEKGGEIHTHCNVVKLGVKGKNITQLIYCDDSGKQKSLVGDYFFSTMPMKELIKDLDCKVPTNVKEVSEGLIYRDFMTVGLLCNDLKIKDNTPEGQKLVTDNWIYIQEPDVVVGRLQIFNNWSPYLVKDQSKVWIGMEYFVNEGDEYWTKSDKDMISFGKEELDKIEIIDKNEVVDACVIRMEKTYPAYFGTYNRFDELKNWINQFENLFLVGRNGMHRYNNQDHSMLTAMVAVENIIDGITDKSNLWEVNAEQEYHEKK